MLALAATSAAGGDKLAWTPWTPDIFARAKAENRFVILDLEAVWCHWCHVMEETTYSDPKVVDLLKSKYLTVRVDQDANPDLANRYGDWGWPATIIFAADGSEIAKRAGYIPPGNMTALLEAIIKDPSPGPSVEAEEAVRPSQSGQLSPEQRADLSARSLEAFDDKFGGWGDVHKFIDADSMDWELTLAGRGDKAAAARAQKTFGSALNLIDRVAGGIYQYSDAMDWKSPHYEKIMWYQANGLRQFAMAYAMWKDPRYLDAAREIKRYLMTVLHSPAGAFYTSQDADVSAAVPGKVYYAMTQAERAKAGGEPRIDKNMYARENAWAVRGLAAYYASTGEAEALSAAEQAARWIIANRGLDGGGYRHGDTDRNGPYLGDTLAVGQAALDLYAASGHSEWLDVAAKAGDFITAKFKDETGGFLTSTKAEATTGVFTKPATVLDEQVQVARFANLLFRYTGTDAYRMSAEHASRYAMSDAVIGLPRALPGILLADAELGREPTHMTIVGGKDNPKSLALHAAALGYPSAYKRVDWWDKREGPLRNPDVSYPELDEPAAFACSDRLCSLPVFEAAELAPTVDRMLARKSGSTAR